MAGDHDPLQAIARDIAEIRQRVERMDTALRGNGKPGLTTRVALLEAWRSGRDRLAWLMIGLAGSCAVSLMGVLVKTWAGG